MSVIKIASCKTKSKLPVLKRESLALRLRQNWLSKYPAELPTPPAELDDSLTSLNWLQNLNIMKITPGGASEVRLPGQLPPGGLSAPLSSHVNPNAILDMSNHSGSPIALQSFPHPGIKQEPTPELCSLKGGVEVAPPPCTSPTTLDRVDYKTNPYVKPPYSYATLICMAMKESKRNKITLSGIYTWITDNFMYYRMADPSWQNSIRHNLSLNKCFQKVARRKDEPGKGGFWRINPEFEDMFVNGIFKKRRGSTLREPIAPCAKRIKKEIDDNWSSADQGSVTSLVQDIEHKALIRAAATATSRSETVLHMGPDDLGDALDLSWSAILNQDIEVGGVRVKTEDIIDAQGGMDNVADSITSLSPPPSDASSDVALEDLLSAGLGTDLDSPFDFTTGDALDLTVSGTCIKAPDQWETCHDDAYNHSGLNTPLAPSPVPGAEYAHPWADHRSELDQAIASLDSEIQSLFDTRNDQCHLSL